MFKNMLIVSLLVIVVANNATAMRHIKSGYRTVVKAISSENTTPARHSRSTKEKTTVNSSDFYEKFCQLDCEMTYEDVEGIIGSGTLTTQSGSMEQYAWKPEPGKAVMVMFNNGKLYSKSQHGLVTNFVEITLSEFEHLKSGMSYEDVEEVIGQGILTTQSDTMKQYLWQPGPGKAIMIMFNQGRLYSKSQHGLR